MPLWLKIVVIMGASGTLLLGLAIGGLAWWLHANQRELRETGVAMAAEGKQYGSGKSSGACVDESFTRLERTSGIAPRALLGIFLKGCLLSAHRDSALCVGVPSTSELLKSFTWRNDVCARRGKPGDDGCFGLFRVIQEVCHPKP